MKPNEKLNPIVTELFLRASKLIISLVFVMKITNKRDLQQIALNHSSNIGFKDFMKLYKGYIKETYSFSLVNGTTLSSNNPSLRLGRAYYKISNSEKIKPINKTIGKN